MAVSNVVFFDLGVELGEQPHGSIATKQYKNNASRLLVSISKSSHVLIQNRELCAAGLSLTQL
jgi:hypothetical protein